jgi:hypothetical protein
MATNLSFEQALANNEMLRCKTPDCYYSRKGLSGYCKDCKFSMYAYGVSRGRTLRVKDYQLELNEIKSLIVVNTDHDGLIDTCDRISKILARSLQGDSSGIPSNHIWANLERNGVKPVTLIAHAAAIYLLSMRQKGKKLLPNHEAFLKQAGNRLALLAPSPRTSPTTWKRPTHSQTKKFCESIWAVIKSITILLAREAEKIEIEQREREQLYYKPFKRPL